MNLQLKRKFCLAQYFCISLVEGGFGASHRHKSGETSRLFRRQIKLIFEKETLQLFHLEPTTGRDDYFNLRERRRSYRLH
jgi:hypothetical protein